MRQKIFSILIMLSLLISMLPLAVAGAQDADLTARLRVIHVADGVPAVDVYINGSLAAQDVDFMDATLHYRVPAGSATVSLRPAGAAPSDAPVLQTEVNLTAVLAYSVVVQGESTAPEAVLYEDILDPLQAGFSRMAVIHAVPGAGNVDIIRADGAPLMLGVPYGQLYGTINIPAGFYDLVVTPENSGVADAIAEIGEVNMQTNVLYTFIVAPQDGTPIAFTLADAVNAGDGNTLVRFVHGIADGAAADVYLDETLILSNLSAGDVTQFAGIPAGDHVVELREAGTPPNSEAFFTTDIAVEGVAQTFAILPTEDGAISVAIFSDAVEGLTPDLARVQVINVSNEAVTVDVSDASATAESFAIGDATDVAPGNYVLAGGAELESALWGGALYTVVVFDSSNAELAVAPLNVNLSSAPFEQAEPVEVAEATPAPEETEAPPAETEAAPPVEETPANTDGGGEIVAAQPTEAPLEAVATEETPAPAETVAVPVEQPTEATQPTVPAPPPQPQAATPDPNVARAVVSTNQGVNLQCREYPSPEARSLGLIPNNTELIVTGLIAPRDETGEIGRTDALTVEDVPDFTPILPEDFGWDNFPQELRDLGLADLWINVTWVKPEGALGCWTNAFYVQTRYRDELIDSVQEYVVNLAEFGTVEFTPYNVPGGPREAGVISPGLINPPTEAPEVIFGTVNVNQNVRLQLRRTPDTQGESLDLIPANTELPVALRAPDQNTVTPLGVDWLYVQYASPEKGLISGWVSSEYIILRFNGRAITLEEVPLATDFIPVGGAVSPGEELVPNAAPPAQPTAPPQDAGASTELQPNPTNPPPTLDANVVQGRLLINPGAQLNLRDRPSADGIVRIGLPSDAILSVNGRNGDGSWLDVSFGSPNGVLNGWVASEFVQMTFREQPFEIKALPITTDEADAMP